MIWGLVSEPGFGITNGKSTSSREVGVPRLQFAESSQFRSVALPSVHVSVAAFARVSSNGLNCAKIIETTAVAATNRRVRGYRFSIGGMGVGGSFLPHAA